MNRSTLALVAFIAGALSTAGAALAVEAINGRPAVEVRLVGRCDGRLMAAMEEDNFPATGCDWIEPIRDGDSETISGKAR